MQVEEQHVNICMISQCSNTGAKTQTVIIVIIITPRRMHIVVTSTGLDEEGERAYL